MTIIYSVFRIVCLASVCVGFSACKYPVLSAAKSAVNGIGAMLLINLVSGYTGCYIRVNTATVFVSSVLSLPGVLRLLLLKIIYNY